jgi:PIN domain nuclease of toxin-antitoxin system
MTPVLADTHAMIWYVVDPAQLSGSALGALRDAVSAGDPVQVATISLVELRYLVDRGRLPTAVLTRVEEALTDPDIGLRVVPLSLEVAQAVGRVPRDAVPDMPDRIIAATALQLGVPLVTRDRKIQAAGIETIW